MAEHSEEKIPMTLDLAADALRDRIAQAIESVAHEPAGGRPCELCVETADAVLAALADADPTDLGLELVGAISHPGGQIIHRAHDDAPVGPANEACVRCGCRPVYARPRTEETSEP